MKMLRAKSLVPSYLHLGSVSMKRVALLTRSGKPLQQIELEWRKLTAQIAGRPEMLRRVFKRLDERSVDPSYNDDQFEVFYTLTEDSLGKILVDFFY